MGDPAEGAKRYSSVKLTKAHVDRAAFDSAKKGKDVRWDAELRGFGLRIYPSGHKSFVLSYRINGRKRLMDLGNYGTHTVDEARKRARGHLADIDRGVDPLLEVRRRTQGETVADLCRKYMAEHARVHKKSWAEDERKLNSYVLPRWRNRAVGSITAVDVAALHRQIGERSIYEANRTIALLSKMFSLAQHHEWRFLEPGSVNPARGIQKFKEKKRDRWVTPQELPALAKAISQEDNVYVRAALWLYLLTGVRKTELLAARWDQVDLERKELRLDDTKAGRTHYVPLSTGAIAILKRLERLEGNPYILPGRLRGKPLVNIGKPWRSIRERANVKDVRLHDLRRTVGSWLAQSGHSLHLIGNVLNHSNASTTQVYARFAQTNARDALESHSKALLGVQKIKSRDAARLVLDRLADE